jgi:hypothetical protein
MHVLTDGRPRSNLERPLLVLDRRAVKKKYSKALCGHEARLRNTEKGPCKPRARSTPRNLIDMVLHGVIANISYNGEAVSFFFFISDLFSGLEIIVGVEASCLSREEETLIISSS